MSTDTLLEDVKRDWGATKLGGKTGSMATPQKAKRTIQKTNNQPRQSDPTGNKGKGLTSPTQAKSFWGEVTRVQRRLITIVMKRSTWLKMKKRFPQAMSLVEGLQSLSWSSRGWHSHGQAWSTLLWMKVSSTLPWTTARIAFTWIDKIHTSLDEG